MRVREAVVQWNTMKEGDVFLRYIQEGAVTMLVVQREEPDLPTEIGSMGYASVDYGSYTSGPHLLMLTNRVGKRWIEPLATLETERWVTDEQISGFTEVQVHPVLTEEQVLKVLVEESGRTEKDLEFIGVNVRAMVSRVLGIINDQG